MANELSPLIAGIICLLLGGILATDASPLQGAGILIMIFGIGIFVAYVFSITKG